MSGRAPNAEPTEQQATEATEQQAIEKRATEL